MESALWAALAASMGISLLCEIYMPSVSCVFAAALGACYAWMTSLHTTTFHPDAFMFIIVPPVVLHSGLTFTWEASKRTWSLTLFMAWVGTATTTAWVTLGLVPAMVWYKAAWLAAVCSPTDTVSTNILTRKADVHLQKTLQHESLLNDAVGYLFTHLFSHATGLEPTIIAILLLSIVGSAALGIITARLHTSYTSHNAVSTLVVVLLLYSAVEWARGSGILALFLFGVCVRQWKTHDMEALHTTLEVVIDVLEKYVYVTMGTALLQVQPGHVGIAGLVLASLYAARIFHVGVGGFLTRSITLEQGIFLIGCNVRGAFTIALASLSQQPLFLSVAILIVIWTHILGLITVGPMGTLLDII